jgi:hypothetical protein
MKKIAFCEELLFYSHKNRDAAGEVRCCNGSLFGENDRYVLKA